MKFLLIILTITLSCAKNIIVNKSDFSKIIYVEGVGGDYAGAKLIASKAKDLLIINSISDLIKTAKENQNSVKNLYLIGQEASNNFIKNTASLIAFQKIFMYSHILDKNLISFLDSQKNSNIVHKITLITTNSQFEKLKNKKVKTHIAHKILKTIDYDDQGLINQFTKEEKSISEVLSKDTILLGGNYKNDNFDDITIPLKTYTKKIKDYKNKNKELSIVLHPRFFSNCKANEEKAKKLENFNIKLNRERLRPTFYLPEPIFNGISNLLKKEGIEMKKSPNFSAIMYGIEVKKFGSRIFASADQCNISADDKNNKIHHFSIDGNKDHAGIIKDAKHGNSSISDLILEEMQLNWD